MINFSQEIEDCLKALRNTNNKEQNFQGLLYHHFLCKYGDDYEVEMETSRDDIHVKGSIIPEYIVDDKDVYRKKEIDLLVYNRSDHSEKYAAELKWIYHRPDAGRWNCLDMLEPFADDAVFVEQLKNHAGFTETCSVVVYDFNPNSIVKRVVFGSPEQEQIKKAFLGGEFNEERTRGTLIAYEGIHKNPRQFPFVWHDTMVNIEPGQKNKYYIIKF